MKTIVGIATAQGSSGVAIVRLSGEKSIEIVKKMCSGKNIDWQKASHKMQFCNINTAGFVDSGYMVYFKAPNSFTGEDVVELFCHGGSIIPAKIVEECIKNGAQQSGAGEFSQRAFISGKLTLDKAEGIIDAINAESEIELAAASKLANGELARVIKSSQAKLLGCLAGINMLIDFPSENGSDEEDVLAGALSAIGSVFSQLQEILRTQRTGRLIKNGVTVVLCGRPNAGKSSVLNALAEGECAIVSSIPGTTRDIVKETILHGGIKFNLCDTAGLRVTTDEIEKVGVSRARDAMNKADLILYIIDGSLPITNEDLQNLRDLKSNNMLVVINKTDLISGGKTFSELSGLDTVEISTLTKKNIKELKNKMLAKSNIEQFEKNAIILTNARHSSTINEALISLKEARQGVDFLPLDVLASLVQAAYNKLGQVTGESGAERIAAEIFAKFCVGK